MDCLQGLSILKLNFKLLGMAGLASKIA